MRELYRILSLAVWVIDICPCRGLVKGVAKAPDIVEEDIEVMFATNVTGLINMTQAVMPIMVKRDEGGRGDIINIGSIAGREAYPRWKHLLCNEGRNQNLYGFNAEGAYCNED